MMAANLSFGDGGISEFEKLANDLEFENKQTVKMIEEESQHISYMQSQIQQNSEVCNRTEADLSRLGEETMRLHRQYSQARETLKNLNNTYNLMMDHEMALSKQLETLKIKSCSERQFYQEQMTNYSNIRDEYMKKYQSFPLAQELCKKKEILAEKQREAEERESLITDLKQRIAGKEAVLDSKIPARMIVKLARLKILTIQTEKEVQQCLIEKNSLLKQLKEIRKTQEPSQREDEEPNNELINAEDASMDCDEGRIDKNAVVDELQLQTRCTLDDSLPNDTGMIRSGAGDHCVTSLEKTKDMPGECFNSNVISQVQYPGVECTPFVPESCLPDDFRNNNHSEGHQEDKVVESRHQKSVDPNSNGDGPVEAAKQTCTSSSTQMFNRAPTLPAYRVMHKPLPKIPTFKPVKLYQPQSKELSKNTDVAVSRSDTPRPKVPAFTHKVSLPAIRTPKLRVMENRSSDSNATYDSDSKMAQAMDDRKQACTPVSSKFSFPRLPKFSAPTSSCSVSQATSVLQDSKPEMLARQNNQASTKSFSIKDSQNQYDMTVETSSVVKEPQFSELNNIPTVPETDNPPQDLHQLIKEPSANASFKFNKNENADKTDDPSLKSLNIADSLQINQKSQYSSDYMDSIVQVDQRKNSNQRRFGLASVFAPDEDHSQSPTSFSLLNLGQGTDDDTGTPFLSFGSTSDNGMDDERPSSLFNLFNKSGSQKSSQNENSGKEQKGFSFLNFGNGDRSEDESESTGGGFLNFSTRFDQEDDTSEEKGSIFNIF